VSGFLTRLKLRIVRTHRTKIPVASFSFQPTIHPDWIDESLGFLLFGVFHFVNEPRKQDEETKGFIIVIIIIMVSYNG
jgi:hypothetical protein